MFVSVNEIKAVEPEAVVILKKFAVKLFPVAKSIE